MKCSRIRYSAVTLLQGAGRILHVDSHPGAIPAAGEKVMNKSTRLVSIIGAALAAPGLAGCGGAKVLKEPEPLVINQPLASASDQRLSVQLDWVIVRGGPGTWAKNADWDEYLIRVQNLGEDPITVSSVALLDSLGTPVGPGNSRKQLVKGTKATKRRYKHEKVEVRAGVSAGVLLAGAAVTGAATAAAAMASAYPLAAGATTGSAAAAATGGLILVPVFAVGGIMRGVNNSRVDNEIETRQTTLPLGLRPGEEKNLDVFFPLTPSPRRIELTYTDPTGQQTLVIDTSSALDGLHLVPANE